MSHTFGEDNSVFGFNSGSVVLWLAHHWFIVSSPLGSLCIHVQIEFVEFSFVDFAVVVGIYSNCMSLGSVLIPWVIFGKVLVECRNCDWIR